MQKAIAISDAKIQFVSLVDKAANKRQFLVTKAKDGQAQFSTFNRILKVDAETHYLTGIVYEPMVEDAHGNYMTEDEIRKAAYWFAKHGDEVDLQHSFESADGLSVVESYVAPSDLTVGDTPVAKGTWLITVECANESVWQAVQKGELTGFSMGGVGKYSEEDVDLEDLTKDGGNAEEKKSFLKRLAKFFDVDFVEKGEVMENFKRNAKSEQFWQAMWALEDVLYRWNWQTDRYEFVADAATIREALQDFSEIVTDILAEPDTVIIKAVPPVLKAGKKMSSANKAKLDEIYQALSDFKASFDESEGSEGDGEGESAVSKEENDMSRDETQALITESITKTLTDLGIIKAAAPAAAQPTEQPATAPVQKQTDPAPAPSAEDLDARIAKAAESAVKKWLIEAGIIEEVEPAQDAPVSKAEIERIIKDAIAPMLKAYGMPQNLNDSGRQVEKADEHYLHGIL